MSIRDAVDQFTTMSKGGLREWLDDFGLPVDERVTAEQLRWRCRSALANARLTVYQDQMTRALRVLRGESIETNPAQAITTLEQACHDARLLAAACGYLRRQLSQQGDR